jgi:hypothetical protein
MVYDRAGCIDVSKQDADPKVVTSPVVKHAVLYPYRDQLMNVEVPANRAAAARDELFDRAMSSIARASPYCRCCAGVIRNPARPAES